jgi:hypothetical protein
MVYPLDTAFSVITGESPMASDTSDFFSQVANTVEEGLTPMDNITDAVAEIGAIMPEIKAVDFFPSVEWLSAYIKTWPERSKQYSYKYRLKHSKQLAYAIVSLSTRKSKLGLQIRSLALNEAPLNGLRDIHIEKNGFAGVERSAVEEPLRDFLMQALARCNEWDEIRLNSMDASCGESIQKIASENNLICYQTHSACSYLIDYSELKQNHHGDYLQSRSTNTRAQLRQSIRKIESAYGQLRVCSTSSIPEAQDWLKELAEFHRQRWNKNGESNNFNDQRFLNFLSLNIDELLPSQKLAILKICAGEKTLAIYYYFIRDEKVNFYIGGVDYSISSGLRPGTVGHFYAVHYFFQSGKLVYDFMEGDSRYKGSLATSTSVNQGWVLQRKTKCLSLEHKLRMLKRVYFRKSIGSGRSTRKDSNF